MNDSVNEFAFDLMARAKAREEQFRRRLDDPETDTVEDKGEEVEEEKENQAVVAEGQDLKGEDDDVIMEEDEEEDEEKPQALPSIIASLPVSRTLGAQSASPISRKTRLSALAQSINSWEDDLGTPTCKKSVAPAASSGPRTPRFSVSTPPQVQQAARGQQRKSCHQFVSSGSGGSSAVAVSPVRRAQIESVASPKRFGSTSSSCTGSPARESLSSSPATRSGSLSPQKSVSSLASPKKTVTFEAITEKETEQEEQGEDEAEEIEEEMKEEAPIVQTKREKSLSPMKNVALGASTSEDTVTRNLELQGFVKVDKPQGQFLPEKEKAVSSAILAKKRMFEKESEPASFPTAPKLLKTTPAPVDSVDTPSAPKLLKTTPAPAESAPKPSSVANFVKKLNASNNDSTPSASVSQLNVSRKSMQPDPSELSVAQKARLFERQQKEQEELRREEIETNKRLRGNPTKPNYGASEQQAKKTQEAERSQQSTDKPRFYFGQTTESTIPPPPPALSVNKVSLPEDEDMEKHMSESEEEQEESEPEQLSPSMLIARSVKPIKVVQKNNKMYPSLTDIENTETEDNETNTSSVESSPARSFNSSMSTSSLGSYIANKAQCTGANELINTTMACQQIDDLIDQALEGQIGDDTFAMENAVPLSTSSPIVRNPAPLVHTVSMYRKNQQLLKKQEEDAHTFKVPQNLNTVKEDTEETDEEENEQVALRIQNLEQQVVIQQKAIAQASKALNVCETSFEFSNSTENVACERALLIAAQKRSQLLSYISKIRNGKLDNDEPLLSPSKEKYRPSSTRGTMRVENIQLYPIKSARLHQDYVYHFTVLIKYNDTVFATETVKTSASNTCIEFSNDFVLQDVDPGFRLQVEVYALRTFKQMDVIPHNMKYHIKTPTSGSSSTPGKTSTLSSLLTPTRGSKHTPKATDLRTTKPNVSSSSAESVRSSNFTLQAVLNLNLSNLNKTEWEMSMVNTNLILPNISMSIKCKSKNELNYKGFLTVFSDVSGLGAWHRRWAMLDQDYRMQFWTYPEDEGQKPPVHRVELSSCITPRVSPASRELCARPNTFLLVTTRDPLPTDKDSLVMSIHEKYTAIKHMFSADNRMERDEWLGVINKALTNMRAWGIHAPQ